MEGPLKAAVPPRGIPPDGPDSARVERALTDRLMSSSSSLRFLALALWPTFGIAYRGAYRTFRFRAVKVNDTPVRILISHEDISPLLTSRRMRDEARAGLTAVRRRPVTSAAGRSTPSNRRPQGPARR